MNLRIRAISFLIFGLLISAFAMAALINVSPDWQRWKLAVCMPAQCFCETIRLGNRVLQPSNTVSSFAFVIVGVLIFGFRNAGKGQNRLPQIYTFIFSFSLLFVGFGSAFYHASLTFTGQFFDVFGMFLVAAFMLVYALERLFDFDERLH